MSTAKLNNQKIFVGHWDIIVEILFLEAQCGAPSLPPGPGDTCKSGIHRSIPRIEEMPPTRVALAFL